MMSTRAKQILTVTVYPEHVSHLTLLLYQHSSFIGANITFLELLSTGLYRVDLPFKGVLPGDYVWNQKRSENLI